MRPVEASPGRMDAADRLTALGASAVIPRAELEGAPERPLLSERWAGAVDAVGGTTLANILASIKYCGAVAACGLTGGAELNTTVLPFLLRGVRLLGIDSVMCPAPRRRAAWERLAANMPKDRLARLTKIVPLAALPELGAKILNGETRGRIVVDVNA